MAQKIKFSIIQSLFRLFSFLADKTNGLDMFAKPKILLGSAIIGLTATACSSKPKEEISCYDVIYDIALEDDTIANDKTKDSIVVYEKTKDSFVTKDSVVNKKKDSIFFIPPKLAEPIGTCYDRTYPPEINAGSNYVYTVVEKMPEFPGGAQELYKFIHENLKYPDTINVESGIQGKVTCRFVVEKDGSIGSVEILRGLESHFDKEAIRVIKLMPNWIPGEQNGEKVRVYYTIPVIFKWQ